MEPGKASSEAADRRAAQDEILVQALAAGLPYEEAGRLAGVNARTVDRRMTDPDFARKVSVRRGARVALVTGQLTSLAAEAVSTLRSGLTAEKPADRLRAAHLILMMGSRFRHDTDLEVRLAEIEQHIGVDVVDPASAPEAEP